MAGLKVFKELELPPLDEIQLNSIYLIGNSNSSHVDIYIVHNFINLIKLVNYFILNKLRSK